MSDISYFNGTMRAMTRYLMLVMLLFCAFLFENVVAQTLSNKGAFIRVATNNKIAVRGSDTADLSNTGTIRIATGDSLIINGSLNNSSSGSIYITTANVVINKDLNNNNSSIFDVASNITVNSNVENTGLSTINSTGTINIDGNFLNDVGSRIETDGNILLKGHWVNNGVANINIVSSKSSQVSFIGTAQQNIGGITNTIFEKVQLNNSNGINLEVDATVDSLFNFVLGKVYTNANKFIVTNNNNLAITGYDSLRYISGNLRRYVTNTTYWLPLGDDVNYERAYIDFKQVSGLSYIDIRFNTDNSVAVPPGILVNNKTVNTFLDYGYWTMSPDAGTFKYDFTIFSKGHLNGGGTADQYTLISRFPSEDWASNATHSLTSQYVCPAFIYAKRTNLTEMGDFIIGKNDVLNLYNQPLITNRLLNKGAKIRIKTGVYVYVKDDGDATTYGNIDNVANAKITMEANTRLYAKDLINSGSTINTKLARLFMYGNINNYNSTINDTLGYIHGDYLNNDTNALFKTSGYTYINIHTTNSNGSTIMIDSVFYSRRNWINNANSDISYGDKTKRGEVIFPYTSSQIIGGTSTTYFENITISNSDRVIVLLDMRIDSVLKFTTGKMETRNNANIIVTNKNNDVIVGYDSIRYIYGNGNLRRYVKNTIYDLPIGTQNEYQKAHIIFKTISGLEYIDIKFTQTSQTPPAGLKVNNKPISLFLDYGYWTIKPDAGTYTYDLVLTAKGYTNGGGTADQYSLISRFNPPNVWADNAIHSSGTQIVDANFILAKRTNFQTFGDYVIGKSAVPLYDQPLITNELRNKKAKIKVATNNLIYVLGSGAEINNYDTAKIYLNNNCTLSVAGVLNNYNRSTITQFTGKFFADSIVSYKSRFDQTTGEINVAYDILSDSSYITQTTGTMNIGLSITNNNYSVIQSQGVINLDGHLYNNATCSLLIDSMIYIKGNWVNNGRDSLRIYGTTTVPSNVTFRGTSPQTISGSSQTKFEKLTIDNDQNISLSRNIHIDNHLKFEEGKVVTNNFYAIVNNTLPSSISGYDTISNYVVGNLRRYVTNNIYDLPVGTMSKSEPAQIEILTNTGLQYIDAKFVADNTQIPPAFLKVNDKLVNEFLDYGYWVITPNSTWSSVLYNLIINSTGHTNGGGEPDQYYVISDVGIGWENYATHSLGTQYFRGSYISAKRSDYQNFGYYIVGRSFEPAYNQPPITNELYNKGAKLRMAASTRLEVKGVDANVYNVNNAKIHIKDNATMNIEGDLFNTSSLIDQLQGVLVVDSNIVNEFGTIQQTTGRITTTKGGLTNKNNSVFQSQGIVNIKTDLYNTVNSQFKLDSLLYISGNWYNSARDSIRISGGVKCSVIFNGTSTQYVGGDVETKFENVHIINNNNLVLNRTQHVDNFLIFNQGKLVTDTAKIVVTLTDTTAIRGYDSLRYIDGKVRRYVDNRKYFIPIGSPTNYELAKIEIVSSTGLNYLDFYFTQDGSIMPPSFLLVNGILISEFLNYGYWNIDPNAGWSAVSYNLDLQSLGHSNGGGTPDLYALISDFGSDWWNYGNHSTTTQQIIGEYILARRADLNDFGRYVIGKSITDAYTQPLITNELYNKGAKIKLASNNILYVKGERANLRNLENGKITLNNTTTLDVNGAVYSKKSNINQTTGTININGSFINDTAYFAQTSGVLNIQNQLIVDSSIVIQTTGIINVYGDLYNKNLSEISSQGTIFVDSNFYNSTNAAVKLDGTFRIKGNWNNDAVDVVSYVGPAKSTVEFNGTVKQYISGTTNTKFENIRINNPEGVEIELNTYIDSMLYFSNGKLYAEDDTIILSNKDVNVINGYDSLKYIVGNMRQYVANNIYNLPIGTLNNYELAKIEVLSNTGLEYIDIKFTQTSGEVPPPILIVSGALVNEFLDYGYWNVLQNTGATALFNLTVQSLGHSNGGGTPDNYSVISDTTSGWIDFGVHSTATQQILGQYIIAKRSNIYRFGRFIIGKSIDDAYIQPAITNEFNVRGAKLRAAASNTIYTKGDGANMNVTRNAKVYLNNATVLNVNGTIYNANSTIEYLTGTVTALNHLLNDTSTFSQTTGTLTVGGDVVNNKANVSQANGTINITGTLTNNNNSLFVSGGTVNLDSSLYNYTSSRLQIDETFNIKGDWVNNAYDSVRLYGGTKGTVVFKGNRSQTISGTVETIFENFTINNSYGVEVDTTMHVDEVLAFTSGVIKTNDENYVIVSNNSISAITGYDSIRYVNGNLRRYVTGTNIYNFPVGCDTDYERAIVEINSSAGLNYIDLKYIDQEQTPPPTLVVNGALVDEFLNKGYWLANTNSGATLNYNISLYSRGHSNGGGTPDNYVVITDTTNGWENIGVHSGATQMFIGGSILAKRSNITRIGNYAIGRAVETPYTQPAITNMLVNRGAKLKMHGGNVYVLGNNSSLVNEISGVTTVQATCNLYVNGNVENYNGATYMVDGKVSFIKNWINSAVATTSIVSAKSGIVEFIGTETQEVSGTTITQFEKLVVNNANNINLAQSFKVDSLLTFTSGKIITNTDTVMVKTTNVNAIAGYDSSKYVIGNLKRDVSNATYIYPIGTTNYYELATINITASTNLTSVNANFQYDNSQIPPVGLTAGGTKPIGMLLNYGYWNITPNNNWTAATYNVILRSIGHTNGGGFPIDYAVVSQYTSQPEWSDNGTHSDLTQSFSWIGVIAQRNGLNNFGRFIVGRNDTLLIPITNNLVNIDAVLKTATDARLSAESNNTNFYNIDNASLIVEDNSEFNIQGSIYNLTNSRIGVDGDIKLTGNWINQAIENTKLYDEANKGTVSFIGVNIQSIKGEVSTVFENVSVNNINGINNDTNTYINNTLSFTSGKINSTTDTLFVTNTSVGGIIGHDSAKYINGNLTRYVSTGDYDFPVGTSLNYELARVNVKSATNLNAINAKYTISNENPIVGTIRVNNVPITEYLDYGYWELNSRDNYTNANLDIFVQSKGHTNGGGNPDNYAVISDTTNGWEDLGYHSSTTQNISSDFISAKRFNLTRFGNFIIAKSPASLYNQPVVTRTVNNISSLIKIQGNIPITISEGANGHFYNLNNATVKINDGGLAVSGNVYNTNSEVYQRAAYLNVTGNYINQNANYYLEAGTNSVTSNIYLYSSDYIQSSIATTNITLSMYNDTNSLAELHGVNNFNQHIFNNNNARIKLNGTINLRGNWTNNAFDSIRYYDATMSNVNFIGSAGQIISGTSKTIFENIVLNNSAGLTLQNNAYIDNLMTFSAGKLFTLTDTLIINNTSLTAIVGFDTTKYISGNLRRFVNTGIYNFPVGTNNYSELAQLEIISASNLNYLDVCYMTSDENPIPVGLNVLGTPMSVFLNYGYWRIIPDAIPTVRYNLNLSNSGHTNGGGSQDMYAVISNVGAGWVDYAYHSTTTQYFTGSFVNASRLGMSQFGNFIVAKSLSPIYTYIPVTNSLHNKGVSIKTKVNHVALSGSNSHLKLTNNATIKVQDNSDLNIYGTANNANSLIETNNGNVMFTSNFTNDTARYIVNGGTSTFNGDFTNNTASITNNVGLVNFANVYNNNVSSISALDKIVVNNSLYNYANASIYIEDTIAIKGNILNNGRDSLHYASLTKGTVEFNGTALQTISGTSRTIFENVLLNNSNNLALSRTSIIDNSLKFNTGKFNTQTDTLVFTNTDITAISGYDSIKYIVGNLRRYVIDDQYDLPIGSNAKYELANIQIISSTGLEYIDIKFTVSNQNPVPAGILVNGAEITEFLNYGYWTILANTGASVNHVVTLQSFGHTNGGSQPENYAVISRFTPPGTWASNGYHSTSTQYFYTDYVVASRSALNNFGDFIIGRSPYQFYIQIPITNELRVKSATFKTANANVNISGINAVLNNYNNATIKNSVASTFLVNGNINNYNSELYNYGILNTTRDIVNYDNAYLYNSNLINVSANINNNKTSEIINLDSINVIGYILNDTLSAISIDGVINLKGNFTNNAETNLAYGDATNKGMIVLHGVNTQYIYGTTITNFENIRIDNPNGVALANDAIINEQLYFANGKLNTELNKVVFTNIDTMAIQGYSETKYIIGNIRRYIGQKNYNIPLGTDNYYQLANLNILNSTSASYVDIRYIISSVVLPPPGISIGAKLYNECLDYGYWEFTPDVTPVPDINYNLMVQSAGHTNGGGLPVDYAIITDINDGNGWQSIGTHNDASQSFYLTYIQARRTAMNRLGKFIVAKASDPNIPLIVNTLLNKGVVFKVASDTVRISGISAGYTNENSANMLLDANAVMFVDGSITNNSSSKVYIDGRVMLKNNWTNNANATIIRNNGTRGAVEFCGDSLQDVCGISQTIFENLVVNNSGKGLRLRANIKVRDTLLMQRGDLNLSSYVINMDTSGMLVGETSTNRVKATDGSNNEGAGLGNIRRVEYINNITDVDVAGLGLDITTAGDLGWVTIIRGHKKEFINGTYSIKRYYDITPQNQGIATTLAINYYDIEIVEQTGMEEDLVMVHYHNSKWNPIYTFVEPTDNKFWATSSTFSKYTGTTDVEQPLPVEMLYFNAYLNNNETVVCTWKTLNEQNSDYFIVERSQDMMNFEAIGRVRATGNSNYAIEYNFADDAPYKGISYYRLKQYDIDGKYKYSDVALIEIKEKEDNNRFANIVLYPNPTNKNMGINIMFRNDKAMRNVNIMMIDNVGKLIMNNSMDIEQGADINVMDYVNNQLKPGLYFIRITHNDKVETKRVIIIN